MTEPIYRSAHDLDPAGDLAPAHGVPGKMPVTARLSARSQIIFRVESAEAARELAGVFGPRDGNGVAARSEAAVDRASSSSGEALRGDVRERFEASLGTDLSGVRVHTGDTSAEAASAVGAKAYTVGQDIHFGAGQYDPSSAFGVHLLAHEVAHTVQQQGGAPTRQHKLEVSAPQDAAETEADRAADAMVAGRPALVGPSSGAARQTLHRKEAPPYKSEFGANGGSAGVMDQMAMKASQKADAGLPPIAVDTKYTLGQAQALEKAGEDLANLHVPGAGKVGTSAPTGVQTYQKQSAEYVLDVTRITSAQDAYSAAIGPAALAAQSFAAVRSVAHDSLGLVDEKAASNADAHHDQVNNGAYKDVSSLGADLTAAQKDALGSVLDKQNASDHSNVLATLDGAVSTSQGDVTRLRLDMSQNALSAEKVVLAKLGVQQKAKVAAKSTEKDAIDKKIAALVDAAAKVGAIAKVAQTVASGGVVEAVPGLVTGGAVSVISTAPTETDLQKTGLGVTAAGAVGAGSSLLSMAVGDLAKSYYEGELNKINHAIGTASAAISIANTEGLELEDFITKFEMKKLAADLIGKLQTLAQALKARKHHLAMEGKAADKKASKGDKNKDSISQLLLLLSNAKDADGLMTAAEAQADASRSVVDVQWSKISGHREELLPTTQVIDGFVVAGKPLHAGSSNDPDSRAVLQMEINLDTWKKRAADEHKYVATIQQTVTSLGTKKE